MPSSTGLLLLLLPIALGLCQAASWDRALARTTFKVADEYSRKAVAQNAQNCVDSSKVESHPGMMWSGEPTFRDVMPSPTEKLEVTMCCQLAGGVVRSEKFSILKYSNHSSRAGQPAYLCAAYGKDAKLVKGNSSITAGLAPGLPPAPPGPPKPNCNFPTAQECIAGGGAGKCFWYGNACSYQTPPELNCIQIESMPYHEGNICMSMIIFDSDPFSSGPSKLLKGSEPVLGKFNWSSGQLNQYTKVTKSPPQILVPGSEVYWWSISTGLVVNASGSFMHPFDATVTYEEIVNGKQTHATGFTYGVSGNANFGIDLSGPGHAGKITGQTVGVNTAFVTAFNMVFWPNVTDATAALK